MFLQSGFEGPWVICDAMRGTEEGHLMIPQRELFGEAQHSQ